MTPMQATAEAAQLMSIVNPLVMLVIMTGWGWIISSKLDKDLKQQHLERNIWNFGQMAAGCLAVFLMLFVPWFVLGLFLGALVLIGPMLGYYFYRNTQVKPEDRWDFLDPEFWRGMWEEQVVEQAQQKADMKILEDGGAPKLVPGPEDQYRPAHDMLSRIVNFALPRGAQQVIMSISADKKEVNLAVVIDGVAYQQPEEKGNLREAMKMMEYIKMHAGMDPQDMRRQQHGELTFQTIDGRTTFKQATNVMTAGSTRQLNLRMTFVPAKPKPIKFDQLGLLDTQEEQLKRVLNDHGRVVIVAAPSGQGLTSTLYSLLDRHDPYTENIITMEETVDFELEGVTHNTVDPSLDTDKFIEQLEGLIRRDPQVVMVGKVTDSQVAQTVVAAATDMRMYVGMPMSDTFQALRSWVKAIGDLPSAAESLGAVISPRLLRKLCMTCRQPYTPDPNALRKMNLPANQTTLYKNSGKVMSKNQEQICPDCKGMGYRGRMAVFEVMALDDQARQLIAAGQVDQLRAYLRKRKMQYIQEAALARVQEGLTSMGEVSRVFSPQKQGAAAS